MIGYKIVCETLLNYFKPSLVHCSLKEKILVLTLQIAHGLS